MRCRLPSCAKSFVSPSVTMPALSYYSNVHNTAVVILQEKGYRVWTEPDGERWCAEKAGWDFMADDPVQLLGLIGIHEHCQPQAFCEYWWRRRDPWLMDSVPTAPPDYISVIYRKPQ
jgi:hypothetical protein